MESELIRSLSSFWEDQPLSVSLSLLLAGLILRMHGTKAREFPRAHLAVGTDSQESWEMMSLCADNRASRTDHFILSMSSPVGSLGCKTNL